MARTQAKAGLWQCLQAVAEQLVQLPALPEAAESSGSTAADCAHGRDWRRVLQSLLMQNCLPPCQHSDRLRAALLGGLDCAAAGLRERAGSSYKQAGSSLPGDLCSALLERDQALEDLERAGAGLAEQQAAAAEPVQQLLRAAEEQAQVRLPLSVASHGS